VPVTQATYERLARAHAEHITIIGIEVTRQATTYAVQNPARAGGHYTVTLPVGAKSMTCNCAAGECGGYCKHRSVVREHILATRVSDSPSEVDARELPLMSVAGREAYAATALAERRQQEDAEFFEANPYYPAIVEGAIS
jgi:hypothetical protein